VEAVLSKTKITMLQDEMRNVNGLQIVGINYPERMQSKNIGEIIKNMNGFDSKKPSILLWHAPTQIENAKMREFIATFWPHAQGSTFSF